MQQILTSFLYRCYGYVLLTESLVRYLRANDSVQDTTAAKVGVIKQRHCCQILMGFCLFSNAGYRATEWGDLSAFLWKGRMRIIEKGTTCSIRLEDPNTGLYLYFLLFSKYLMWSTWFR